VCICTLPLPVGPCIPPVSKPYKPKAACIQELKGYIKFCNLKGPVLFCMIEERVLTTGKDLEFGKWGSILLKRLKTKKKGSKCHSG